MHLQPPPDVSLLLRRDAVAAGRDDAWLRREVRAGRLVRVRHGVYADPRYTQLGAADQHRVRAAGIHQYYPSTMALSHVSAALAWGAPDWGLPLSNVHVTQLDGDGERTEAGVVHHHGEYPLDDLTRTAEGWVSTPARAVIESLPLLGRDSAVCVLDWVQNRGLADADVLDRTIGRQTAWPHVARSRDLLAVSDAGAQSVGETRSRLLFRDLGLPAPVTQYPVRDRHGRVFAYLDFAWPDYGVAGEFDGRVKYVDADGRAAVEVLMAEKWREDRIREELGWRFVRWTWYDLARPHDLAARLRRALRLG